MDGVMNVNERLCCILAWRLGGRFVLVLDGSCMNAISTFLCHHHFHLLVIFSRNSFSISSTRSCMISGYSVISSVFKMVSLFDSSLLSLVIWQDGFKVFLGPK
jgi:hypothetical protein